MSKHCAFLDVISVAAAHQYHTNEFDKAPRLNVYGFGCEAFGIVNESEGGYFHLTQERLSVQQVLRARPTRNTISNPTSR